MASITQQPAQVNLTGVAGSPFTLTLNITGTDSESDPIPWGDFSGWLVVTYNGLTPAPSQSAPTITNPEDGTLIVSWSDANTAALATGGPYSWALGIDIEDNGPYFLCAGSISMPSPTTPGGSTSTAQSVAVSVGTATVNIAITRWPAEGEAAAEEWSPSRTVARTITIGGTLTNPTVSVTANTFDAHGAAAAAQAAAEAASDPVGSASTAQSNAETFATSAVGVETARAEAAEALLAPLASPSLTGTPTTPTATLGTNTTQIASTAFVEAAVAGSVSGVSSFNTRTGAVAPTSGDYAVGQVTGAAPLASPALTGTPTAPTQTTGDNTTKIATDAFVSTAVGVETTRAEAAEALLAPLASPALTGTPTAPTKTALTNNT